MQEHTHPPRNKKMIKYLQRPVRAQVKREARVREEEVEPPKVQEVIAAHLTGKRLDRSCGKRVRGSCWHRVFMAACLFMVASHLHQAHEGLAVACTAPCFGSQGRVLLLCLDVELGWRQGMSVLHCCSSPSCGLSWLHGTASVEQHKQALPGKQHGASGGVCTTRVATHICRTL